MKTNHFLLAVGAALSLAYSVSAQTPGANPTPPTPPTQVKTTDIIYNFDGKTLISTDLEEMKPGKFYRVIVRGINNNLYKVYVGGRDTVTSKALTMPTFSTLDISGITSAIAGILLPSTTITVTQPVESQSGSRSALTGKTARKTITKVLPIPIEMAKFKAELTKLAADLAAEKKEEDDLMLKIYAEELNLSQIIPSGPAYTYAQAFADINTLRNELSALQTKINDAQQAYAKFSDKNQKEIAADDELKATDKAIADAFTKLSDGCDLLITNISADKVKTLLTELINDQNNAGTEFTSLPFQFRNDQAKFVLSIEPRDPSLKLNTYKQELDFPLFQKSYAAVGISFYGSTLYDEAYTIVGTPVGSTTTNYRVVPENYSKFEIGMAALLRLGRKFKGTDNTWGGHFSIGPGVSISNSLKPRILAGGGLSWGEKHMFTIDAGFIAGYVNRLSSAIDLNNTSLSVSPTSTTVSHLNGAVFFSLGYLYRFP